MSLHGRKLGLLLSCGPDQPNFDHGVRLAQAALEEGLQVYLYCIDDAVNGMSDSRLKRLVDRGVHLFACAYGAQRRNRAREEMATWAGLATLTDIISGTDRFLSFN